MLQTKKALLAMVTLFYFSSSYAQFRNCNQMFYVGIGAHYTFRPTFDRYLLDVSQKLELVQTLSTNLASGLNIGAITRNDNAELEVGFSFNYSQASAASQDFGINAKLQVFNAAFQIGGNYFFNDYFFAGGQVMLESTGGNLNVSGPPNNPKLSLIESTPSYTFFNGNSASLRLQSGIQMATGRNALGGLRIVPYFDIGLRKSTHIDSFSHRLVEYNLGRLSRKNVVGLRVLYVI